MNKFIASIAGIGFLKGGGTYAAMVTCGFMWLNWHYFPTQSPWLFFAATILITLLGVHVSNVVEPEWGEDSSRVVIDEVAGMMITMLFIPAHTWPFLLGGLVLFRFFDILKPLGIRKMENLPSGSGVMMDDVLAGIYGNVILWVIYWLQPF
jgi:phosphatidylglycerophosphatase A